MAFQIHVLINKPAAASTFSVDNGSDVDGFRSSDVVLELVVLETLFVSPVVVDVTTKSGVSVTGNYFIYHFIEHSR